MNKKDFFVKIHAYVSADGMLSPYKCKEVRGNNTRIRKRLGTRFFNSNKILIDDFISSVKKACPHLNYIRYNEKRIEVDIRSQVLVKELLKLGEVSTKSWEIPKDLNKRQKAIWIKSFTDCDGTVQNRKYDRFIAIDSINLKGLKEIAKVLQEFEITSHIYKIKYKENLSYRLKIYRRENLLKFKKLIGLNHPGKQKKLNDAINSYKRTF